MSTKLIKGQPPVKDVLFTHAARTHYTVNHPKIETAASSYCDRLPYIPSNPCEEGLRFTPLAITNFIMSWLFLFSQITHITSMTFSQLGAEIHTRLGYFRTEMPSFSKRSILAND